MAESPSWPSLYNPRREIIPIQHRNATQPGASYLHHVRDIFVFTYFWTLLFYIPMFILCGTYAFVNISFPPNSRHIFNRNDSHNANHNNDTPEAYQMSQQKRPLSGRSSTLIQQRYRQQTKAPSAALQKRNERRSRLAFGLLVMLAFFAFGMAGAVVTSAVVSLLLAALFRAGELNMSTWIPFLWAAISVIVGLVSLWPSIINII